ncbi:MAG: AraC family transcriptional regulator [Gemmatimonadota bacterium]
MPEQLQLTLWTPPCSDEPVELLSALYSRHRFPAHAHDTFAIGVVVRGTSSTRYRGDVDVHRPGGVIIIEPGEMHTGEPHDADGWGYRMIYPSAAQLAALSGTPIERIRANGLLDRSFLADPELAARFLDAHALLQPSVQAVGLPGDMTRGSERMTEVLGDLTALLTAGSPVPAAADELPVAVGVVRDYLEAHFATRVTLAQLTELVSLSPYQLIRVFRRAVGVPPYAYLALIRVQRARALLRRGESATHVAFATGFCDQSHFTRVFRHIAGMTPGQYAQAHRASAADVRPAGASRRAASPPSLRLTA